MKLFVFEYITSGALANQDLPESLTHEGNEMLNAIIRDCNELSYLDLTILRDHRLPIVEVIDNHANHHCHYVSTMFEYQRLWQQCLDDAEAILIIAPETGDVLTDLHQQAVSQNKVILGCQVDAIESTTNKLTCHNQLRKHDIAVADTYPARHWPNEQFNSDTAYITKPIDGAGCINTYVFNTMNDLNHYLLTLSEADKDKTVIQPYIKGTPASMSLVFSNSDVTVLAINGQHIECQNNVLTFTGCHVNGITEDIFSRSRAYNIAKKVQNAIPGLWGFVGIDFIINETSAIIVDINPRITSSYSGLKNAIKANPMTLLLRMKGMDQVAHSFPDDKQAVSQLL